MSRQHAVAHLLYSAALLQGGRVGEFESGQGKCDLAFGVPAITLFNDY